MSCGAVMSRSSFLIFVSAVFVSILMQTTFLTVFLTSPFKPDLLLVILVFIALRSSYEIGTPVAWMLGLLKDVFGGLYLGMNSFTFLIIFLIIKGMADRLYAESCFLFVFAVIGATLACVSGNMLLLVFTNTPGIAYTIGYNLIPHLLTNAFAASLVALLPGFTEDEDMA